MPTLKVTELRLIGTTTLLGRLRAVDAAPSSASVNRMDVIALIVAVRVCAMLAVAALVAVESIRSVHVREVLLLIV